MSDRRNCKNLSEPAEVPFELQGEEARNLFLTAAESERRAWIEEKYPGFMSFMNRQHSNRGCNNDDYPSDEFNDARSDAGLPDTYNDEEPCVTVDELAKLLRDAELTTQRPASALSNTYVNSVPRRLNNDILIDMGRYDPEETTSSRLRNCGSKAHPYTTHEDHAH
uniref:Uncharacterized protein n=1 Tax=Trichogramma kaykai TaxID=54128 RepID=A0ABD2WDG8_9HYME